MVKAGDPLSSHRRDTHISWWLSSARSSGKEMENSPTPIDGPTDERRQAPTTDDDSRRADEIADPGRREFGVEAWERNLVPDGFERPPYSGRRCRKNGGRLTVLTTACDAYVRAWVSKSNAGLAVFLATSGKLGRLDRVLRLAICVHQDPRKMQMYIPAAAPFSNGTQAKKGSQIELLPPTPLRSFFPLVR